MKTIRVSGLFGLSLLAVISVACAPAHNEPRIAPAKEDAGLKMEQPAQPEPSPQHVEAGTPAPSNPELNEAESSEAIAPTMVRIPGGCFQMGSPPDELGRDNERQHEICVEAFSIGKYEVTQAEWEAVMGSNPSRFSGCADCPVENVSWDEVQEYIGKLNADTGGGYRLPTEAEWEYAARAGSTTAYPWGDTVYLTQSVEPPETEISGSGRGALLGASLAALGASRIIAQANCDGCGSEWDGKRTAPVGSFEPNAWGLHDTAGNVREWTCSAYDGAYGGTEQRCASTGDAGSWASRGGSWLDYPREVRSASRGWSTPDYRDVLFGFRLAQD